MIGADSRGRGPVWAEFTRAQNGLAITNLARAFHLPRPQAKVAVLAMLATLTQYFDEQTLSRPKLSRLIELLGKNGYEQVLETPTLMGATSTQVIGNEALTALAGRNESHAIASSAAAAAGISEMIAEYLLPVVAAMFMGALAAKTRGSLLLIAQGGDASLLSVRSTPAVQLPVGRGSGGFSGTGGATGLGSNPAAEKLYLDLAERIRSGAQTPGHADPLQAARRAMAEGLGVRTRQAPWLAQLQRWTSSLAQTVRAQAQRLLRPSSGRRRDDA